MYQFLLYSSFFLILNSGWHSDNYPQKLQHEVSFNVTRDTGKNNILFGTDEILHVQLKGEARKLINDRGDNAVRHSLLLSYLLQDSSYATIPIEAKTRGNFRRTMGNCTYPPIMLYFNAGDSLSASIFAGQKKLKLVVPCRKDEYIVREWLAYKLYNLISPQSFRVRLLKMEIQDTKRSKQTDPFFAMLLEDEKEMAERNQRYSIKKELLQPNKTDSSAFFTMALFQFMIGNTDWSVQYMQNIKLITTDTSGNNVPVTVPYDFDMSGWVDAPYGKPADALLLRSVRERRFRGYCINDFNAYAETIQKFQQLKAEIYQTVNSCSLLPASSIKTEIAYLDAFYALLNEPDKLKKELLYPCDKNGTGNVVISGLKNAPEIEE